MPIDRLDANEEIRYQGKLHWAHYFRSTAMALFAALIYFKAMPELRGLAYLIGGVAAVDFLGSLATMLTTEILVTDRRILTRSGLVRRITLNAALSDVADVHVSQDVMGRFCGYGKVKITLRTGGSASFEAVAKPFELAAATKQAKPDTVYTSGNGCCHSEPARNLAFAHYDFRDSSRARNDTLGLRI